MEYLISPYSLSLLNTNSILYISDFLPKSETYNNNNKSGIEMKRYLNLPIKIRYKPINVTVCL